MRAGDVHDIKPSSFGAGILGLAGYRASRFAEHDTQFLLEHTTERTDEGRRRYEWAHEILAKEVFAVAFVFFLFLASLAEAREFAERGFRHISSSSFRAGALRKNKPTARGPGR